MDAMGETDIIGTGRDESLINPVMTEVALPGNALILIKSNGIVGTYLYASLASRAFFVVHDHNPVFSLLNSFLVGLLRQVPEFGRWISPLSSF